MFYSNLSDHLLSFAVDIQPMRTPVVDGHTNLHLRLYIDDLQPQYLRGRAAEVRMKPVSCAQRNIIPQQGCDCYRLRSLDKGS